MSYVFPSRRTFSQSFLPAKYESVKESLLKVLEAAEYLTLTTDGWTSVANESYISVTAHFITNKWTSVTCLLECVAFEQRHTSQNLCEELQRVATKWDISEKVHAVTTDNAPSVVNSVKLAGWSHIPCFAHS